MINPDLDQLVQDATRRGIDDLQLALQAVDELARGLCGPGDKTEHYRELSAGLDWSKDLLDLILALHAVAASRGQELSGAPAELFTQFGEILKEIVEGQQHHDDLLLADILKYELQPFLAEQIQPLLHRFAALLLPANPLAVLA